MSTPAPLGNDFQVNTESQHLQDTAAIAALAGGGFVVTWTSYELDENENPINESVHAQIFAANGTPVGDEIAVNSLSDGKQFWPSVTGLADGGFVIVWHSDGQDGDGIGVYGQRYAADGSTVGGEFRVNTATADDQAVPAIAALADGGFVVSWASVGQDGSEAGVYAQRYASNGTAAGSEFKVNTTTTGFQSVPAVAGLDGGGFVIVWEADAQDGSGLGLYGQRYAANGSPLGGEFLINTTTADHQTGASVAALADGGFVVTWATIIETEDETFSGGIFGQRFAATGTPVGSEFQINTFDNMAQAYPSVTALSDGGFVVNWTSYGQDGLDAGVYGQRFAANGTRDGDEFRLNQITGGDQTTVGSSRGGAGWGSELMATLADGNFVAAWWGQGEILARLFEAPGGGNGGVTIFGTEGNDVISPSVVPAGQPSMTGLGDTLYGLGGNDELYGGEGDDRIDGGVGADRMYASAGDDTYVVDDLGDEILFETASEGTDTVETSLAFYQLDNNLENLAFTSSASLNVGFGNILDNVLTGTSGSDSFTGNYGNDTYLAGGGSDYLYIDSLDTSIDAGEGYDAVFIQDVAGTTLNVGAADAEWVYAWTGDDTLDASSSAVGVALVGEAGADQLIGSAHNDYIYMDGFDTLVDAGDGYDALFVFQGSGQGVIDTFIDVSAADAEWVLGGAGNDTITNAGDADSVALSGGGGNDSITGGLGSDYLYGNAGADTFVVTSNAQLDAILDFEAGVDKVDLTAVPGIDDFADLLVVASEVDGSTMLDLGGGNQLLLYQVSLASLSAGDFIFAP